MCVQSQIPFNKAMKICYCDESGTGFEPIAVMVGILVDSQRMHITKNDWNELLSYLSDKIGRKISELHTGDFYSGKGVFHEIDGPVRAAIISEVFRWFADRKHHVVYSSVCKKTYNKNFALKKIPDELNTVWRFMGFHIILSIQKHFRNAQANKGDTIFIFDNEEREQLRFTDIIARPPKWSDEYYYREPKEDALDKIIDVPYWGDSQEVALIQLADFFAFFLRRYSEIKGNLVPPKYADEATRINEWINVLSSRSIGTCYKKIGKNKADALFYGNAPACI